MSCRAAYPRHHSVPTGRAVRPRGSTPAAARTDGVLPLPIYATAKVHRDHHIEVAKALYSIPGNLIGARVEVRADTELVKVFHRGTLVKVHPRQTPGGRSTDPADLPSHKTAYALRDIEHLKRMAAVEGDAIGVYAAALLDNPLPWTKMRQVYALLGLVKRWGAPRVEAACVRALEAEAVNVGLIGRMLQRATETQPASATPAKGHLVAGRFARDPAHFATQTPKQPHLPIDPDPDRALEANTERASGANSGDVA
jgi:hypothetical protein